jgi:hypothetical protein
MKHAFIAGTLLCLVTIPLMVGAAGAQQGRPFETYATTVSLDEVDDAWLNFCLAEGFHAANAQTRVGTANHLGLYVSRERYCLDFSLFPIVKARYVEITFTAADGDQLYGIAQADFDFSNPNPEVPPGVVGFGDLDGGTGRFENATGSYEIVEVLLVDGFDSLHFVGTISFDASDRSRH